jgi:hypothetical protein
MLFSLPILAAMKPWIIHLLALDALSPLCRHVRATIVTRSVQRGDRDKVREELEEKGLSLALCE